MGRMLTRLSREQEGFTLIELLIVVIILGILATIVVLNVSNAAGTAKTKSFVTALVNLQSASDQFFGSASDYPAAVQPVSGTAQQISLAAKDTSGNPFQPNYTRTAPDNNVTDYGLVNGNTAVTGTLSWGVTYKGTVFASSTSPANWLGTTCVFTQDSVRTASGPLNDASAACGAANGTVALSSIQ